MKDEINASFGVTASFESARVESDEMLKCKEKESECEGEHTAE